MIKPSFDFNDPIAIYEEMKKQLEIAIPDLSETNAFILDELLHVTA